LGTNDSKLIHRPFYDEFNKDYQSLIQSFRELPSHPRIVLLLPVPSFLEDSSSIYDPIIKKQIIPKIQEIAFETGCEIINLYSLFIDRSDLLPDKIHPSSLGATLIAKRLYELVKFKVPILHIVDSVADSLRDINVTGTIGIMGTQATIELGLYQNRLTDWDCIVPTQEEMNNIVQPAIDLIKAGDMVVSRDMLMAVVDSLISRGANAVVLGCTELPLAVKELEQNGVPLVNSIDSLVKRAIFHANM
jgi:hypothetical protein